MRYTVSEKIEFRGVGLHGGQPVRLVLHPAAAGHGIVFERSDIRDGRDPHVPARHDLVVDTRLCSRLANSDGVSVGTVEHLMAALAGAGISDVRAVLDGPEVPILDGSSLRFVRALTRTGRRALGVPARTIRVLAPVVVEQDGKLARLDPAPAFEIDFTIEFSDPAIGRQRQSITMTGDAFARELSDCRTFGHLAEVEALRRAGLARGGSLENAIVVDRGSILNPEGLRRRDEFVRHKMLDAVGDLALAGAPIVGRYTGVKAGHEMTNLLLHALFADAGSFEWAGPAAQPLRLPRREVVLPAGSEAAMAG